MNGVIPGGEGATVQAIAERAGKAVAFDILGDPVRRRLLELLAHGERTSGEMTVVIEREFGISQSAVSQHLKVLRDGGFASVRAEGARRIYAVAAGPLSQVDAWLAPFRAHWAPRAAPSVEAGRGRKARAAKDEAAPVDELQLEMF